MKRIEQAGLTVNTQKKKIKQTKVRFFGLIIGAEGVEMDPRKVAAISDFERPKLVAEVRSFLGMCNWSARFIKNHADIAKPLRQLTSKELSPSFNWDRQCEKAFQTIKSAMINTNKLFSFDHQMNTELVVDASPTGLGGILAQIDRDGHRRIVAYASKALNPTQQRYSQTER